MKCTHLQQLQCFVCLTVTPTHGLCVIAMLHKIFRIGVTPYSRSPISPPGELYIKADMSAAHIKTKLLLVVFKNKSCVK